MKTKEHNYHSEHHPHMDHEGVHPTYGHMGNDHHKMMIEYLKRRFWISSIITIPVLILSEMIQMFLGFHLSFVGDKYVLYVLSSIIFFYGSWPFLNWLRDEIWDNTEPPVGAILMSLSTVIVAINAQHLKRTLKLKKHILKYI